MVEINEEKGFVENVETTIKEVELQVNQHNEEQINKIVVKTGGGNITWKPKVKKESFEGGFKVVRAVPMEKPFIPKILTEIATLCTDKGQIRAKVSYTYWKTEKDGQPITYRFINSEKILEKWEILDEEFKTEEVMP